MSLAVSLASCKLDLLRIALISTDLVLFVSGAVVARDLINYGYKVRATTRAAKNIAPLVERFDRELGPGRLEIVEVPNHEVEGAYDQALQGE